MPKLSDLFARNTAPLIAVAIFITFAISVGDTFLAARNLENLARQIAIDAPMVFGQAIVLIVGGIDLSVGSTMAMSAVLAIGLQEYGAVAACFGAMLFGIAVGTLNGLLVTRARINPFIATLGTMSLTNGIMLTYTHQQPLSGTIDAFSWWGGGSFFLMPVPFILSALIALALTVLLKRTRAGR